MGDRLQADKPSRYVTSHLGQLSLPSLEGWKAEHTPNTPRLHPSLYGWGEGGVCSLASGRSGGTVTGNTV